MKTHITGTVREVSRFDIGAIADGNYTKFYPDGTMRRVGNATSWKDMVMDVFSKKLNSNVGKVDYDWDNNSLKFQSGGLITDVKDRVQGNQEINHELVSNI